MSNYLSLHHCSLIVADTRKSLAFYRDALGLDTARRPDLPFPGAWLQIGEQQIHLIQMPNPDPTENRPEFPGYDRHTAVRVKDLAALAKRLAAADIAFTRSDDRLFCRDPDGNGLEFVEESQP